MTSSYYSLEEEWAEADFLPPETLVRGGTLPVELVAIFGALLIAAALGWGALALVKQPAGTAVVPSAQKVREESERTEAQPAAPPVSSDPAAVIAPYDVYVVTQGVHGLSYGHRAVDIAAGKGEPIRSPISGVISAKYVDEIGNPTLVIDNERFAVTLLHGIYQVEMGDIVAIGEPIGVESNIGNTRDMQGNSCRDRDCGYHTHLNVYDKIAGSNVNPLELFTQQESTGK